ncbi:hypothetical protein [Bacillus suaedae]|uniref:Uncharacterized protein n=1 Tax=Halalkalibacter suaedae TaxID=2822140 RepID=A0A940WQ75_9BACI|nr:hypothetical protein [Bacillus suaedae]MBP3950326.1 hypothetical protein [Bacillus suaedae]
MFNTKFEGSICYEVKTYRYVTAGRTMAEFEILLFEDGKIGSQGNLNGSNEGFSPAKVYLTVDDAVQEMINEIEKRIANDPWVQQTEKLSKRDNY